MQKNLYNKLFLLNIFIIFGMISADASSSLEKDPIRKINRSVFAFNIFLDDVLIKHFSKLCHDVTPRTFRMMVRSFIRNLFVPFSALNCFLQGKFKKAFSESIRFLMNSSVGVCGLVEFRYGLEHVNTKFADTLCVWGIGLGPYLVLPVIGPSSFGGVLGGCVDFYADPIQLVSKSLNTLQSWTTETGVMAIDYRITKSGSINAIKKFADPYIVVRSAYIASFKKFQKGK